MQPLIISPHTSECVHISTSCFLNGIPEKEDNFRSRNQIKKNLKFDFNLLKELKDLRACFVSVCI